jgi:hypothetical protein
MLVLLVAWPAIVSGEGGLKGGTPRDKAADKKAMPTGTWQGVCADGGPDWGDPMPIVLAFREHDDGLAADMKIDFESDTKEARKATATLKGKRISGDWSLTGTMLDANDKTEWEIRLEMRLEGNRLSGRFLEADNKDHLMCRFSWTRK